MSIKAMVENIVQIPNINGKLLPPIITSTGLKQRDKLSPILFDNLFDDVDQIFDSQCNPVMFNSEISLNNYYMLTIWLYCHFHTLDQRSQS